jgi:hypothetical protein
LAWLRTAIPVVAMTGSAMAAAMTPPTAETEMSRPTVPVLLAISDGSTALGYVQNGAATLSPAQMGGEAAGSPKPGRTLMLVARHPETSKATEGD